MTVRGPLGRTEVRSDSVELQFQIRLGLRNIDFHRRSCHVAVFAGDFPVQFVVARALHFLVRRGGAEHGRHGVVPGHGTHDFVLVFERELALRVGNTPTRAAVRGLELDQQARYGLASVGRRTGDGIHAGLVTATGHERQGNDENGDAPDTELHGKLRSRGEGA